MGSSSELGPQGKKGTELLELHRQGEEDVDFVVDSRPLPGAADQRHPLPLEHFYF